MEYRELGRSGVKVREISFGCWTMGGLNWVNGTPNGWANVNEDEVTRGIKVALDAGVNHFDNADVYGNGKAERMLARMLRQARREDHQSHHRDTNRPLPRHGRARRSSQPISATSANSR